MPDIDEAVISAISDTLKDVTFRANRLQEWMDLEIQVLKLVNSFERLNGEVRRAYGSGPGVNMDVPEGTWPRIIEDWESCRATGLIDVEQCVADLVYLNQEVMVGGETVDLQLDAWLTELDEKETQIDEALMTSVSPLALRTHCSDLDKNLKSRVSRHRQRVKKEVGILAEVTLQLRTRLEALLPSEPVNE
jgi:hypothetical protein